MEADHTTRVPVKDLSCVGEAVLVGLGSGSSLNRGYSAVVPYLSLCWWGDAQDISGPSPVNTCISSTACFKYQLLFLKATCVGFLLSINSRHYYALP